MRMKHGFKIIDGDRPAPFVSRRDILFGAKVFIAVLAMSLLALYRSAPQSVFPAPPASTAGAITAPRPDVRIIDGDTVEDRTSGVRYRLVNIDTPESGKRAKCSAERRHAELATTAVRTMIASANKLEILTTGRTDRYGRTLARIELDGLDLGAALVDRALARPWRGRREPWCDHRGNLVL